MWPKGGGRVRPPGNEMSKFTNEELIARTKMRLAMVASFPDSKLAQMDKCLAEIAMSALSASQFSQPVLESIANAFIAAIEKEQERRQGEDYLVDSRDCIAVIREELQRLNACRAGMQPEVPGDDHATD